jgi:hypothetical protein
MSHTPRYSDRDLASLHAALLARTASVVAGDRTAGTTGPFGISETRGAEGGTGGIAVPLAAGASPRAVPAPRDSDPRNGAKILIVDDAARTAAAPDGS